MVVGYGVQGAYITLEAYEKTLIGDIRQWCRDNEVAYETVFDDGKMVRIKIATHDEAMLCYLTLK